MYDPSTKSIQISCDVRWMGKFYNDGHLIEIPEYKEKNSRNMKSIPPPIRYDDAQKESDLMKAQEIKDMRDYRTPGASDEGSI